MLRAASILALVFALTFNVAVAKEEIPVMGNWQGGFSGQDWRSRTLRAQIVAESWTTYRAILYVGARDVEEQRVEIKGKTTKGVTHFEGQVDLGGDLGGVYTVTGDAAKGIFTGVFKGRGSDGNFELKRVLLKSPTLGVKPPEGAVVLMLNEAKRTREGRQTFYDQWNVQPRWTLENDGAIRISGSSIVTKKAFGDALYHIEFQTPFMPNDRGQARGNSGVYIQGRYEIQVLDSFSDEPRDNLCGGIYQLGTPIVNACLPPLEWQTYDITFYVPRFDENGKKTKNAEITVKHNGKVIHNKIVLRRTTPGGVSNKEAPEGVLLLQDHSDRVAYRNVWVKPLD